MSAPVLMVLASLLFATMGLCVKLASAHYAVSEIIFYRGLVGAAVIGVVARRQGASLRTAVPGMHFWRTASGVTSLFLWFYAIGNLPLATGMTLSYTSPVWMALFLMGGAVLLGGERIDPRLIASVLLGFAGVGLVLRPTIADNQLWHGLVGLLSGMVSATAYLQVATLARAGEPALRIVFYFSLGCTLAGAAMMLGTGPSPHTAWGLTLLIAVGLLAVTAQLMLTRAYAIGKTLVNASLQYLVIAFSFVYGVLLFDDDITWMTMGGMLLIAGAGLSATRLQARAVSSPSTPAATPES